tara:strand:+ start:577 stop:1074 length:498 start_codon:yes stop_codon:yes gene_type:complete
MAIQIPCPECSRLLSVDELHAGMQARCPACECVFTIPHQNAVDDFASETSTPSPNPFAPSSAPVPWEQSGAPEVDYQNVLPHRGTLVLVMGILSWFLCCVFGIVAWYLGSQDIKQMNAGRMDPSGLTLTKAGYWIGVCSVLLQLLIFGGYIVMIVVVVIAEANNV